MNNQNKVKWIHEPDQLRLDKQESVQPVHRGASLLCSHGNKQPLVVWVTVKIIQVGKQWFGTTNNRKR